MNELLKINTTDSERITVSARALFKQVKNVEKEKLGDYDVWPNMIQKDNLLKALHISRDALLRDLELREANKKSAPSVESKGA